MRRVTWSDRATADLAAAGTYLNTRWPELTQEVLDRLVLSTDFLLDAPGIGTPIGYRRWRKWRVRRTAYLIFYQAGPGGVTVVRVLHTRSDWRSIAG